MLNINKFINRDLIFLFIVRFFTGVITLFEILYLPVLLSVTFKLFDYQRSILLNFAVLATFGLHSGFFVLYYKLKEKKHSFEILRSTLFIVLILFFFSYIIFVIYKYENIYSFPLTLSFLIILILEKYLIIKNKLIFSQTIKALNSTIYLIFAFFLFSNDHLSFILISGIFSIIGLSIIIKIFVPEFFDILIFNKIRIRKKLLRIIFDLGYKQILATFLFGLIIIILKAIFLDFYSIKYNAYSTMMNLMIMFIVLNSILNLYYNKKFASATKSRYDSYNKIKTFLKSHLKPLILTYLIIYLFFTPLLILFYNYMNFEFNSTFIVFGLFCISFLFLTEYFNYVVIFLNKQLFYVLSQVFIIVVYVSIYFSLDNNLINLNSIENFILLPLLILGILNVIYLFINFTSFKSSNAIS